MFRPPVVEAKPEPKTKTRRFVTPLVVILSAALLAVLTTLAPGASAQIETDTCYIIDEGNTDFAQHLVQADIASNGTVTFTDLGAIPNADHMESIAYRNGFEPQALYTYDPATENLVRLDVADGTTPSIVATATIGDVDGLTWRNDNDTDPSNDELWGTVRNTGALLDEIVRLDPATGAVLSRTDVLTSGDGTFNDVDSLAWDPGTDRFYSTVGGTNNPNKLVTIDGLTGVVTEIGNAVIQDIEGMGFTDDGELYGMTGNGGSTKNQFLSINKTTGVATIIGDTTVTGYNDFESLDCAGVAPVVQPDLQIRLTVVPAGDPCPATYADAVEGLGDALPVAEGDDVTYCLKVRNEGPGDAINVVVSHPLLGSPVALSDLAAGEEDMTMFDDTVTPTTPLITDARVDGQDTQGNPVEFDEDPAIIELVEQPNLQIRLTVVPAGDPCPATYADAVEGLGDALPVAEGDDVTYCLKVRNEGPGDAINVVVSHPLLGSPVALSDLAAGEEDMTMFDDTVTPTTPLITDARVDGQDTQGNPVEFDEDPAIIETVERPALDIRLTVVPAGDPCPATYADGIEGVGPALPAAIGDDVTYCVNVINNGPGAAQNVTVEDPLNPGRFLILSATDLAPNGEATGSFDVTVDASTPAEVTAKVNGEDTLGNPLQEMEDPAAIEPPPPPATLGNYVWNDLDGDGVQDDNEPPVPGVVVTVLDDNGDEVGTATTNADGEWSVTVPAGTYTAVFTLPDGMAFTGPNQGADDADSDADPDTGATEPVTVAAGESNTTLDAGLVELGSLGDFVFEDANGNGLQDAGELPVAGVVVEVFDSNGDSAGTDTTDAEGKWLVGDLPADTYTVKFTLPDGREFTTQDQGGDDAVDSDADPATGLTGPVPLAAGQDRTDVDAGLVAPPAPLGSISNLVFEDTNGDGIQGADEPGVPGIVVTVFDSNGDEVGSATTDDDGNYIVGNLPAGQYTVQFDAPGRTFTAQDQGTDDAADSDADPTTGITGVIDLGQGVHDTTVDAGLLPLVGSLGDYVFEDTNENGVQDAGEPPVAGVVVEVFDSNGDSAGTDTTDAEGKWLVGDLPADTYTVKFTAPEGREITAQDQGGDDALDSDADPTTGMTGEVTLAAGQDRTDVDAGLLPVPEPLGSISNFVFEDTNSNGIQDDGEPGVPGVVVTVYNADGEEVGSTTTNADGEWIVGSLPAGDYTVEFTAPDGRVFTENNVGDDDAVDSDADPVTGRTPVVSLDAGENDTTVDAGLLPETVEPASLGDYVFEDLDEDGIQDAGEPPVAGAEILIYEANPDGTKGDQVDSTVSADDGSYGFDGLEPGDYIVVIKPPAGFGLTTPNVGDDAADSDFSPTTGESDVVTLDEGENNPTIDAGLVELGDEDAVVVSVDPYRCASFTGNVSGGVAPYTIEFTLVDGERTIVMTPFVVSAAGAFETPDGFVDNVPDGDYNVSVKVSDSSDLSVERLDLLVAPIRANCDDPVTPGGSGGTVPLPYPGPFTNGSTTDTPTAAGDDGGTTATSPPLAVTGSSSSLLATIAIAMMGAGGALLIAARREGDEE